METLKSQFESAWDQFARSTASIARQVGTSSANGEPIHDVLRALYAVPYWKAKELILTDGTAANSLNAGPIGGLFFERLAGEAVLNYLRSRVQDLEFFVGRQSPSYPAGKGLPRDPDMCVERRGRVLVFEFKSAAKKRDLDYAEALHRQYADAGVLFLLCGGEVVAGSDQLIRISAGGWASFLDTRKRNEEIIRHATMDALLRTAESWLRVEPAELR